MEHRVTLPPQLSVAESTAAVGTNSEQATVIFAGGVGGVGATLSFTIIFCDTVELLPQASVNVQVRTIEYELAQLPGVTTSFGTPVILPPQLSVAESTAAVGTNEAQVTVIFAGAAGATGGMLSFTVMVCEAVELLPQASVNVQVRTIEYELAQLPGVTTSFETPVTLPPQLSVAESTAAVGTNEAQVTVTSAGAAGRSRSYIVVHNNILRYR